MRYAEPRLYANPEAAARRIMEIAKGITPPERGKIYIELINYSMLYKDGAKPMEYWEGLQFATGEAD